MYLSNFREFPTLATSWLSTNQPKTNKMANDGQLNLTIHNV